MTFFEQQIRARRVSRWLYAAMGTFVIVFSLLLYLTCALSALAISMILDNFTNNTVEAVVDVALNPVLMLVFMAIILTFVFGAAALKYNQLVQGGVMIARLLGGKRVYRGTKASEERTAVNVVDEMAIASGIPTPLLFVMPGQHGINAFAAGTSVERAVVGVTEGAIEHLTREELEAVVAHEYSHILNGDMLINMRLTAVLYGIDIFYKLGQELTKNVRELFSKHNRTREEEYDPNKVHDDAILDIVGLPLYAVGWFGHLVAHILKASVSRQREYLADSSAVQFTRNPLALASALKKVGGNSNGSKVITSATEEFSHFFFASAFFSSLEEMLASHPPLPERISTLDPSFDGAFPRSEPLRDYDPFPEERVSKEVLIKDTGSPESLLSFSVEDLFERIGMVRSGAPEYVQHLLHHIPPILLEAAHEPYGARACILALLLDSNEERSMRQIDAVIKQADPFVQRKFRSLSRQVRHLPLAYHLPLLDITLPALAELSPDEANHFLRLINDMTRSGETSRPLEFTIEAVASKHTAGEHLKAIRATPPSRERESSTHGLLHALVVLGHPEHAAAARAAYEAAVKEIEMTPRLPIPAYNPQEAMLMFKNALHTLRGAPSEWKDLVSRACSTAALHDGDITTHEAELIRAVFEHFDLPAPPLPIPVDHRR